MSVFRSSGRSYDLTIGSKLLIVLQLHLEKFYRLLLWRAYAAEGTSSPIAEKCSKGSSVLRVCFVRESPYWIRQVFSRCQTSLFSERQCKVPLDLPRPQATAISATPSSFAESNFSASAIRRCITYWCGVVPVDSRNMRQRKCALL